MPGVEFYIIVVLGALTHALKRIIGLKNISDSFSFKIWWKKNGMQTVLGLGVSIILITILPASELTRLTAFSAGYSFDSLLKTKLNNKDAGNDNK